MDKNEEQVLDSEYKRYLEIMRPYLGQLLDQDVIEICNAWIQRLSHCEQNEKALRNKYIFAMCYQLAKGILEEPFLQNPTSDELTPLQGSTNTDDSLNESSEIEYVALDLDSTKTKVLYNKKEVLSAKMPSSSEVFISDRSNGIYAEKENLDKRSSSSQPEVRVRDNKTVICYNCPNVVRKFPNVDLFEDIPYHYTNNEYEYRAHNLIMKLREIKLQNLMLHDELTTLRKKYSSNKRYTENLQNNIIKADNSTSVDVRDRESATTINCLKTKLQEIQDSRKSLIEKISSLQEQIDNFNEIKRQEIDEVNIQHRLEIIQLKTFVREETKTYYEKYIEELNQKHEQTIQDMQSKQLREIENLRAAKEASIVEKNNTITSMEIEIKDLKKYIEEFKNNQNFIFSNDNSNNSSKCMTQKAEELEKRLNKMEKAKSKYSKAYEVKLANLQKEKHLTECSFQLQLMKQRAQVLNETVDEHQTELASAMDKLESKYKDIVANVQATAVQRRIQDQMALESIIQTVCGVRNEGLHCGMAQAAFTGQLSHKAVRNQARDANQSCDTESPTVTRDDKVGSVIVGSLADENALNRYCSDSDKFSELFERVCVPQRDTGDN